MRARAPAVADIFYAEDPDELAGRVSGYLASTKKRLPPPRALIAPHAGYAYSGQIAASAFGTVRESKYRRVLLLGPAHRAFVRGLATSSAEVWNMPMGDVKLDRETIARLEKMPFVSCSDPAHAKEHSLEVELPFLQTIFADFTLVPLVVGDATIEEVESVIDAVANEETLVVVSSDLSHYEAYDTARELDRATADAIVALAPEKIGDDDACGRAPIRGLLSWAKHHGLRAELLDLRNSGDMTGERDRVVGYGAFAFSG